MDGALEDTICAVATPVGEGGVGIVRISGPGALAVAERIVRLRSNRTLSSAPSHTLHLADVLLPSPASLTAAPVHDSPPSAGELVDEALVVFMASPRSFTGEDVVEIHCHGNNIVLGLVCEACLSAGSRMAQPGEFTKRAFLNGRLDLSQAEAVLDTIRAKSEAGLKIAQRHLRGELGQQVGALRSRLLSLLAHVEAGIDFIEEDIAFVRRDELMASLVAAGREIQTMLETSKKGRMLRNGARVVIAGKPNVGKSSLLNRLLGEDRAIVTDIPGTTRDLIEESVVWDGLMITLVDTAGLRVTADAVEQEGIRRTRSAMDQGDLVLHVLDASDFDEGDLTWPVPLPGNQPSLVVINKCDLVDSARIEQLTILAEERTGGRAIVTSLRTGTGLDRLRLWIGSCLSQSSWEPNEGVVVTNLRHRKALERASGSLEEALDSVRRGAAPEFVAMDLRGAADALGEVTGEITSDEILDRIFSEFCIGK